ncbi:hypothetical protein SALBM217S_09222 [Streptomyces griseoloalbus]
MRVSPGSLNRWTRDAPCGCRSTSRSICATELGFTEIVLRWPIPDSDFAADQKVFERIAMEAPAQLR